MPSELEITSKLPSRRGNNEFYRYYAGYPIEFAEWAINKLSLPENATVFDPWNGSGTTVAACAKLGLSAKGYDLNPVMVHLGRARIASAEDFQEATDIVGQIEIESKLENALSVFEISNIFRAFPVSNESAHSILLTSLYPRAPKFFGFEKTKNPTWYAVPKGDYKFPFDRREFFFMWRSLLESLQKWSVHTNDQGAVLSVERADSRKTYGRAQIFDGVVTSPPYLTRIDYVKATLPEFTLLRHFEGAPDSDRLRRSMLGSPLTNRTRVVNLEAFPERVANVLEKIRHHESKASETYYANFFSAYFFDLHASLRRIHRALKVNSRACFVVQPSSYKEILVDLPDLLVELSEVNGFSHVETVEFEVGRSMSLVNSKAHVSARKPKAEFAVFLERNE